MTKRCGACGQVKGPTGFHTDRSRPDGLSWSCRACRNATDRERTPRKRERTPQLCPNCQNRRHGHACTAAIFGPWCPCKCRAVLGLDGPFEFPDPTAPAPARIEEVA